MTPPAPRPPERELRRAYKKLGSIPAVAQEYGIAYETARRWLTHAGVEFRMKGRPSKHAADLDVKVLIKRYEKGESVATIGEALGVAPATVRARLLEAGIKLRPRRGWPPPPR
jgi:transposase